MLEGWDRGSLKERQVRLPTSAIPISKRRGECMRGRGKDVTARGEQSINYKGQPDRGGWKLLAKGGRGKEWRKRGGIRENGVWAVHTWMGDAEEQEGDVKIRNRMRGRHCRAVWGNAVL